MTDIDKIKNMYNSSPEYEYLRLVKDAVHEAEFCLTIDVLNRYIRKSNCVLDLGSGPGRYSEYLIDELDCKVALVDLSQESLNLFLNRMTKDTLKNVIYTKESSALDNDWIEENKYDNVLLMGPLYHLIDKDERSQVLQNVGQSLKNKGLVIASFISPYKNYVDIMQTDLSKLNDMDYLTDLKKGITFYKNSQQYRCWPDEAIKLFIENNFKIIHIRNLEGIGFNLNDREKKILKKNSDLKEKWINLLKQTCENKDLLGATLHFIIVAEKCV